jgi:hypothetical protein
MAKAGTFERRVQDAYGSGFQAPLIEVGDTLEAADRWFTDKKIPATAADLLQFAELVLTRKDALD